MKIKKIGTICNAGGYYYLMDQRDDAGEVMCQWLGDGKAVYPLVGLPTMDLENICAMFDITEKKREKLVMRRADVTDAINLEDVAPFERELHDPKLCVRYDGMDLLPLETSAGVTFIQEKYLLPLDGLEYMRLYERRNTSGGLYIAAKIGMILQAVIMPMDLPDWDFMNALNNLTRQCKDAMRNRALMQGRDNAPERELGPLFRESGEAGEGAGE